MMKAASAALVLVLAVAASPASKHAPAPRPTASPALHYPTIVRVVSRPICSALRDTIGPTVLALLQNDATIQKSRPLFDDYNKYVASGSAGDSSGFKDMTLMRMSNLVTPLVKNFEAIDKYLNNTAVFHYPPRNEDDRRLLALRAHLQQVRDDQESSLDVINGFAQTKALGEMQHEGIDQAKAMNNPQAAATPVVATPNPLLQDADSAGLPPDPHSVDPANIPGLSLGSNPVTRLIGALQYTQAQARAHETPASKEIFAVVQECSPNVAPSSAPAASP